MRTSSGQISGEASSRAAAWGSTPAGSSTRCRPTGDDAVRTNKAHLFLVGRPSDRMFSGAGLDHQDGLRLSCQGGASRERRFEDCREEACPMITPAQPYDYRRRPLVEPDWRRLPGWREVSARDWADPQWQRAHCVKNVRQLRGVYAGLLPDAFYTDLERDQAQRATMSLLMPPQMVNTIVPHAVPDADSVYAHPVRRDRPP